VNPSDAASLTNGPNAAAIGASLEQLTNGWTTGPGVPPEALAAAREAIAQTLVAGRPAAQIHAVANPIQAGPPSNPALSAQLTAVAAAALAKPQRAQAIVRSALAATATNPAGIPDWARGAKVARSFGPFLDQQGVAHWVDLIVFTTSIPFAYPSPAAPFAVFPIQHFLLPPPTATDLPLGQGSVWFLANLVGSSLPAGNFTGFSVTGGSVHCSATMTFSGGNYIIPAGATLTLKATLAPLPAPVNPGGPGQDAVAAAFTPPAEVTVEFTQTSATFAQVQNLTAKAYGSAVTLRRNQTAPAALSGQPVLLIPCDSATPTFTFKTVVSKAFVPAGTAPVQSGGWLIPMIPGAIGSLLEAAGPGGALVVYGKGSTIKTDLEPKPQPVAEGIMEIGTGYLMVTLLGLAEPVASTYQLWPLAAPSKLNATVNFDTGPIFGFIFLATPGREVVTAIGNITTFLDRPLTATGARLPFTGGAFLQLDYFAAVTFLFIFGLRKDVRQPIVPLALENAVLGVDAPAIFVLAGVLQGRNVKGVIGLYFNLRWLLPTLPDPYAANFDLSLIPAESEAQSIGTLLGLIVWTGGTAMPTLGFLLLPPPQGHVVAGTPFPATATIAGDPRSVGIVQTSQNPALLDLSTRVDLWGVAYAPGLGGLPARGNLKTVADTTAAAPALAIIGMELLLNDALVATFALPQFSWEPMESATGPAGPIICEPASDGLPLLISAPDVRQLVEFSPEPALARNIENVNTGHPFAAIFSLPFGLNALVVQGNQEIAPGKSLFGAEGGQFRPNMPEFPDSFVPNPSPAPPKLRGAITLKVTPTQPDRPDAMFSGATEPDTAHGPFLDPAPDGGYGYTVIGATSVSGVAKIFHQEFGIGGKQAGVPIRRIDFSGYGASIYSDWNQPKQIPPAIIKAQFDASIGRTAYEVIEAESVIYPYCIYVVRTITMARENVGWILRTDSGWQAASQGLFEFPPDTSAQWAGRIHPGALAGVFNVRNIRDVDAFVNLPGPGFQFKQVLFDADLGVAGTIDVTKGGFHAPVQGIPSPPVLVSAKNMIGWVQIAPVMQSPTPDVMRQFFEQTGPFNPAISCSVQVGASGGGPGTTLRCSAFTVDIITEATIGDPLPAIGAALRGAPQIPRGGGWSMGKRHFTEPSPAALPNDFPLPLVQPAGVTNAWFMADVGDVLQLDRPDNYYNLMHSTGTNKVLFESPQIPVGAATPGLQFPKPPPGSPKPGGAPINQGSPNLGDIASILNSTGLFPDVANAISMIQGAIEQINTISQGIKYSKTYDFDPNDTTTLIDLGIIKITLQYADTTDPSLPHATLNYSVDSSASPSWSLSVGTLSFIVDVDGLGTVLTITGGFKADEHTKAGLSGLNVQLGDALSIVKNVFSDLQALAQFLPGGIGANLDVALSNGKLTVSDSFTIGDLPLALGHITDISLNLGLAVSFSPLSVDFSVGIGGPQNPFNWIVDPLAGNGSMTFGVKDNLPAFTIQAGIGLGLAIDLGIAEGSASITIAVQLQYQDNTITLMAILTGQASVDVLGGLASASITLSAAVGFSLHPFPPNVHLLPPPVTLGPEDITLIASCSVGIHISICWVISINFDGSWTFSQTITAPQISI
jgi:hypothetical protein